MRGYNKNKLVLKFHIVANTNVAFIWMFFNGKVKRETVEKTCIFLKKFLSQNLAPKEIFLPIILITISFLRKYFSPSILGGLAYLFCITTTITGKHIW